MLKLSALDVQIGVLSLRGFKLGLGLCDILFRCDTGLIANLRQIKVFLIGSYQLNPITALAHPARGSQSNQQRLPPVQLGVCFQGRQRSPGLQRHWP